MSGSSEKSLGDWLNFILSYMLMILVLIFQGNISKLILFPTQSTQLVEFLSEGKHKGYRILVWPTLPIVISFEPDFFFRIIYDMMYISYGTVVRDFESEAKIMCNFQFR